MPRPELGAKMDKKLPKVIFGQFILVCVCVNQLITLVMCQNDRWVKNKRSVCAVARYGQFLEQM